MSKPQRSSYRCHSCGHVEPKWLGRCPKCGEWSSLVETAEISGALRDTARSARAAVASDGAPAPPVPITEIAELNASTRLASGMDELDRVLGGGLVRGSLVLLGGDPGVGKSTLLTQMLRGLAGAAAPRKILYATGEESIAQTALRARRVGALADNLVLVAETDVDRILDHARRLAPAVVAIDSIQTISTLELGSAPGSIAQVRECAARLMAYAKGQGVPTVVVGHVTKDGAIAGPKTLEHLVDVVLHFEADRHGAFRILRGHKNRFGSTQEIGVFEMGTGGLAEVREPSASLLAERPVDAPGSVVVAAAEGNRPLLIEIQALIATPSAGIGRRTAAGVDGNRVSLLLAVLAQRADCDVLDRDVFVNVAGGMRLTEPAIDLGIACAIVSSAYGRAVDKTTVVLGEIGLAGELRAVPLVERRLAEARKLGFTRCILPAQNRANLENDSGLELVGVDRLSAALAAL